MERWHGRNSIGWLLVALLLVCLMPTNQSLWIDEAFSLPFADEPTAAGFATRLLSSPGSERLMPLGMLSTWAGSRVFGRSEMGIRAASIFWAAVAVFLMWRVGVLVGLPWLGAVFACHAFLWYYASEARPYSMMIAMGSGLLYSLVVVICPAREENRGPGALLLFGPLLCGTHVLGVIPFFFVAFIVAVVLFSRKWKPRIWEIVTSLVAVGVLIVLAIFYLPSFIKDVNVTWREQWASGFDGALFSGYELLGFMGFGPGRIELRELAISGGLRGVIDGLMRPSSLGLIFLACIYFLVLGNLFRGVRTEKSPRNKLVILSGLVVAGTVTAWVVASSIMGSSFWGRHVAALLPFVVFVVVAAAGSGEHLRKTSPNALTLLLAGGLLASSIAVRFAPAHSRDDYRSAARLAVAAANNSQTVWWAADASCAQYYGVKFCGDGAGKHEGACVVYVSKHDSTTLAAIPFPDLVVLSKPDLNDKSGDLNRFLTNNNYQETGKFVAFQIFEPR